MGVVVEGKGRYFLNGTFEVDVKHDGVVVATGHGQKLVLEDNQTLQVPRRESAVLVVGAEGAGLKFVPVWDVQDAEEVCAKLVRVDDAGDEVASFHDEANALSAGAGEAGGYDGTE